MKMSFRWYGESDPVSLEYISQIPGMRSIVSAVYDVKPGEVWPEESIEKIKKDCEGPRARIRCGGVHPRVRGHQARNRKEGRPYRRLL